MDKRFWITILILTVLVTIPFSLLRYGNVSGTVPTYLGYNDIYSLEEKARMPGTFYLDKEIEYPVLTGFFIQSMATIGQTKESFFIMNWVFLLLFAVVTTFFLYKIAEAKKIRKELLLFWPVSISFILFSIYNWDVLGIMFTVIAFYFIYKDKDLPAAALLSLGLSAKFFPALFLIPLMLKRDRKQAMKILSVFVLVFIAVNGYFMAQNFSTWFNSYSFHMQREPNIDSVWGIVNFFSHGYDIGLMNVMFLGLFVVVYMFVLYNRRRSNFFELSFLSMIIFLIFSKVFSPQFLLWFLPFFLLLPVMKKKRFYSFEISNAAVFFSIMAWYFLFPNNLLVLGISEAFVLIRHAILIYLFYYIMKR